MKTLTWKQEISYDALLEGVINNKTTLLPVMGRQYGKTTIINELGLTLQALGYYVIVWTDHPATIEYVADKVFVRLRDYDIKLSFSLRGRNNLVILFDEVDASFPHFNYMIHELEARGIPVAGFVFKRRYSMIP